MVFQNYALYPHMTVEQNLGIGLKLRHVPKAERAAKVAEVAGVLGLEPLLKRKPAQLSGGQRQRVAMGRAMVREPQAFLMDEPLSNLDAKLRVQMRAELAQMRDRLKTTTLYVTHDQVEAMTLGDRVAVINDGVVQQLDRPQALYNDPANVFVAAFIGSPSMNLIEATVEPAAGCASPTSSLPLPRTSDLSAYDGRKVVVGIRPNEFEDAALMRDASLPSIDVAVDMVEELGAEMNVIFTLAAPPVVTDATRAVQQEAEETETGVLGVGEAAEQAVCTAQVDARSRIRAGGRGADCASTSTGCTSSTRSRSRRSRAPTLLQRSRDAPDARLPPLRGRGGSRAASFPPGTAAARPSGPGCYAASRTSLSPEEVVSWTSSVEPGLRLLTRSVTETTPWRASTTAWETRFLERGYARTAMIVATPAMNPMARIPQRTNPGDTMSRRGRGVATVVASAASRALSKTRSRRRASAAISS